jgi:hypothetical protein
VAEARSKAEAIIAEAEELLAEVGTAAASQTDGPTDADTTDGPIADASVPGQRDSRSTEQPQPPVIPGPSSEARAETTEAAETTRDDAEETHGSDRQSPASVGAGSAQRAGD